MGGMGVEGFFFLPRPFDIWVGIVCQGPGTLPVDVRPSMCLFRGELAAFFLLLGVPLCLILRPLDGKESNGRERFQAVGSATQSRCCRPWKDAFNVDWTSCQTNDDNDFHGHT